MPRFIHSLINKTNPANPTGHRERFGNPVENDSGDSITFSFPPAETIALCSEQELRDCRIGFRAPYLKHAAESIRDGSLDLNHLRQLPMADARTQLTSLKGVGPKIADCVLLFGLGFHDSFPIDVWIHRILKRMYFEDRPVSIARLQDFSRRLRTAVSVSLHPKSS